MWSRSSSASWLFAAWVSLRWKMMLSRWRWCLCRLESYLNLLPTVTRLPTRCLCYQGSRPRQFSCRKAAVSAANQKHKAPSNHESTSGFTLVLAVRLSGTCPERPYGMIQLKVLDGNAASAARGNAVLVALDLVVLATPDLVVLAAPAVLDGNAAMTFMFL